MRLRAKASTILSLLLATSSVVWGQYVQIPSTPGGFPAQPSYVTPTPGTFTAPSLNPAPSLGPPPAFDAYASPSVSGTMGAPPASVPYGMTPGAPATAFPQQPGAWQGYPTTPGGYGAPMPQSTSPSSLPYQWQQGSYSYQGADGSLVKFQKFLQRIGVENTWLADVGGADAFGMNRLELAATFGIPVMHNIETPLLLTPGFAFNWLDGPQGDPNAIPRGPDLPPRVYDAYLDLSWYPQPFEWFGAELGVRTGVWTDFEAVNSDSVRILGRGVGVISVNPHMDFLIGVAYLDRLHIKLLPVVGVHWRPSTEWDLYIVFPNPKLRKRMRSMGNTDWWWYVAGEYGGGSWTVDRVGLSDRFDYNDIRVSLGVEYESPTMARGHFEVGYVFDREILFNSGQPGRFDPADTVMVRAGFDF